MITLSTSTPCVLSKNPLPDGISTLAELPIPFTPAYQALRSAFNLAYQAAQPLALQAYCPGFGLPNPDPTAMSVATAIAFIAAGLVVDFQIMVWGWDPFLVMLQRLYDGYTWVPNAGQSNVQAAPGASITGVTIPYDPNNPPIGAISVSANVTDYPSQVPAPPTPSTELVGSATGTSYTYNGTPYPEYNSAPGTDNSAIPNGGTFTDARGTFTKIVVPMGFLGIPETFWILTGPA